MKLKTRITISDTSVQMLFALLRASLHETDIEQAYFMKVSNQDWQLCYRLAAEQGVMALAWDGVEKLSKELQPPIALKLKWATNVEIYEKKYQLYCATVDEVSRFYAENGIATLQLKGVGFSTLYPKPNHREGGDIDIFTYSIDKQKLNDNEANRFADQLMQQRGIEVDTSHSKHSVFYYNGIPFENHKTFLNVEEYYIAKLVDKILQKTLNPQEVSLVIGKVLIPSSIFNTLFIASHTFQHYGCGMSLHHLCDWAMILRRYGLQIPKEIKDRKYLSGIVALTQLCNRYLGTSQPTDGAEQIADEMMAEILTPRFMAVVPYSNRVGIIIYKTRRLIHVCRLKYSILEFSLTKRILESIVSHILHPKTIFQR